MFGPSSQIALFPSDDSAPELLTTRRKPGISVRESGRARRLSIKVYPRGKVEVVVPKRTRPADVASFVEENRDWIARARESFAQDFAAEDYELPKIIELPGIGTSIIVRYTMQEGARQVRYRTSGDRLNLSGNTGDEQLCVKAIRRWLSDTARKELGVRLESLSHLTGISYNKLHIRAQRTCWGSRSSSGTISLNLCLLFLDPALVRYLLIHELCHGRHMNHSRRFWKLVSKYEPDYRRLDKALNECWKRVPAWLGLY